MSNYYFTSARILNSTTAQLAKVEAIPEFPWRTAIQAAVAALPDDLIQESISNQVAAVATVLRAVKSSRRDGPAAGRWLQHF